MQEAVLIAANISLARGAKELVRMYTDTALILNACDVAARVYSQRIDNFQLSTTANIPPQFRLPVEIDRAFHRDELPAIYTGGVLHRISGDFLIRMVSLMDDTFEDLYAGILAVNSPELEEKDINKKVRGAWRQGDNGHVQLVNYLINEAGLVSPAGKQSTVEMVFDRYYEIREIRHALVHSGGVLSDKHLRRLKELSENLPEDLKEGSLTSARFIEGGVVMPGVNDVLGIRHWAYTTIFGYFKQAFKESVERAAATA